MIKIIVDKMPKYVWECPFYNGEKEECTLDGGGGGCPLDLQAPKECSYLSPLSEMIIERGSGMSKTYADEDGKVYI